MSAFCASPHRAAAIQYFRAKDIENAEAVYDKLTPAKISRLTRLLQGDLPTPRRFDAEFADFCEKCPEWRDGEVKLFWTNYDHLHHLKVLRVQQATRTCSVHAVVVLKHYLGSISRNEPDLNLGMINVTKWQSLVLSGEKVRKLLDKGLVVHAELVLDHFCGLQYVKDKSSFMIGDPLHDSHAMQCAEIEKLVTKWPALISNFTVRAEFKDTEKVSYDYTRADVSNFYISTKVAKHTMVLVGVRRTETGRYIFLVQNWWNTKQFVEISSEYLWACEGIVTFVNNFSDATILPADMGLFEHAVETDDFIDEETSFEDALFEVEDICDLLGD